MHWLIVAAIVVVIVVVAIVVRAILSSKEKKEDTFDSDNAERSTDATKSTRSKNTDPVSTGAAGIEKEELVIKGRLELIKIKVDTTFDICSDEVKDFNDYENFYILEDGGDYYHWLKEPKKEEDKKKLDFLDEIIPITLSSDQDFKFEATFKVLFGSIDNVSVCVNKKDKDDAGKYQFDEQSKSGLSENEEFRLKFKATNKPYKDTIQYFEKFELIFDITDGDDKRYSKKVKFRLYVTWKEPDIAAFSTVDDMKIKCKKTGNPAILESLLYFGCVFPKGLGKNSTEIEINEEQILDGIFKQFEDLFVTRVREKNPTIANIGMGYWRGLSVAIPPKGTKYEHKLKFLLAKGEARCPQWARLFIHIAWCHGINVFEVHINAVDGAKFSTSDRKNHFCNTVFLVGGIEGWTISSDTKVAPVEKVGTKNKAQGNKKPLHFFWDHVFAAYDKKGKKKFYDPSYGIKSKVLKDNYEELLESYSENALDGVLYSKISNNGSYFYDKQHTNTNVNLFLRYYFPAPNVDKYEYNFLSKTSLTPMNKGLCIGIVDHKNNPDYYLYYSNSTTKIEKL